MSERATAEHIIRALHTARGAGKPIAIEARDLTTFRPWLHMQRYSESFVPR